MVVVHALSYLVEPSFLETGIDGDICSGGIWGAIEATKMAKL